MSVTFNIIFWRGFDFEARLKNLQFTTVKIKQFSDYCNSRGIDSRVLIFDFSENKEIANSIHVPYPINEYRRSEKINRVLEYNKLNICPDVFCLLDSDIFFLDNDYSSLCNLITGVENKQIFQSNVFDIQNLSGIDFDNYTATGMQTIFREVAGIGGFWIVKFNEVFSIGGYDERFTVWGGEDDNLATRMKNNGCTIGKVPASIYHLPHASLQNNIHHRAQYYNQCRLLRVSETVTRHSIITNKYLV